MHDAKLAPHIRSDDLALIFRLIDHWPQLAPLIGAPKRLRVVLDTNVLLNQIIWMVAKRREAGSRTKLLEAIASGSILAFAPPELDLEMLEHLPRRAAEEGVGAELLLAEWERIKPLITWVSANERRMPAAVPDPDDLPFYFLSLDVAAHGVYTEDTDHFDMGSPVLGCDAVSELVLYARDSAIECTIRFSGLVFTSISLVAVQACLRCLRDALRRATTSPITLVFVLIGTLVFVANPPLRRRLLALTRITHSRLIALSQVLLPLLCQTMDEAKGAHERASAGWSKVEAGIPKQRRFRASDMAFAVLARRPKPTRVLEIVRLMRVEGYTSSSPTFPKYLAQCLRKDSRFTPCSGATWMIASA